MLDWPEKRRVYATDIYDAVFRTCNRLLATILFFLAAISAVYNFTGFGIDCLTRARNNWCWSAGVTKFDRIAPVHHGMPEKKEEEPSAAYASMPMMFLLQALGCYAPLLLWQIFEGRVLSAMVMGYHRASSDSQRRECATNLANHIRNSAHKFYVLKYFVCYIGSLGAIVAFSVMTKVFLYREEGETHPVMFPLYGECKFKKFEPSGTVGTYSTQCSFSANVMYASLLDFVYKMYIIAGITMVLSLFDMLFMVVVPGIRDRYLVSTTAIDDQNVRHRLKSEITFDKFFILYLISKNVDTFFFTSVLENLAQDKNSNEF